MHRILALMIVSGCSFSSAFGQWQEQKSGVDVQLRGVSAVSETVAWASGASGTILRTLDGGQHWEKLSIQGTEKLDFRNVRGFDDKTAYVLSIGPGEQSRIYETTDGGQNWQLQFTNHEAKAFYDCFAFWDRKHGIAVSDSVDGKFHLLFTSDGSTWAPLAPRTMPAALPNEGAFAASGTCITTYGSQDVWFATGGPAARVFHSVDRGMSWTVATTPILSGEPSQGIFSIVFWSGKHGLIVGGDYMHPENAEKTAAVTGDGGETWSLSAKFPSGYRSGAALAHDNAAANSPLGILAVGTNGADISKDGSAWVKQNEQQGNAVSFAGKIGWVVGPHGRIARVDEDLEVVLDEMDHSCTTFSSAQGDFEWLNYQKVVDETEKQSGKVHFRRSGKGGTNVEAMFDVASPAPKQILFKSGVIDLYNPKIDQITEYVPEKHQADVDAFLNLGFGSCGHELLKAYKVKMAGWETVDGTRTAKIELTPLSPKVQSMFTQFVLWIDPRRDIPLQQQVFEPSGDYWRAHYTGFILGQKISEDHFLIKKTPKTTVVTPE